MKKIAIITSLIAIGAIAAAAWQIHVYDNQVRSVAHQLETENLDLESAVAELKTKINLLTNHPAMGSKAGNI